MSLSTPRSRRSARSATSVSAASRTRPVHISSSPAISCGEVKASRRRSGSSRRSARSSRSAAKPSPLRNADHRGHRQRVGEHPLVAPGQLGPADGRLGVAQPAADVAESRPGRRRRRGRWPRPATARPRRRPGPRARWPARWRTRRERLSSVARRRRPWARTRSDVTDPSSCASSSPARADAAGVQMQPGRPQQPLGAQLAVAGRGALQRQLDQLGGGIGGAARDGHLGGGVELGRDRAVGAVSAVGQMARPLLGVPDVLGRGAVGGAPLRRRRRGRDRRSEQGVHERDPPAIVDPDDASLLGGRERRGVDRPGAGLGQDCGAQQRPLGRRRKL